MCVYFSDPDCSGRTGATRLIVVKAIKERRWFQAKVYEREFDTLKFFFSLNKSVEQFSHHVKGSAAFSAHMPQ